MSTCNTNEPYRQIDCFDLCFQELLIKTCKCYTNTLNKLNGTNPCLDNFQSRCASQIHLSEFFLLN